MKRFWNRSLMALAAVAGIAGVANAQTDWAPSSYSTPSSPNTNLTSWSQTPQDHAANPGQAVGVVDQGAVQGPGCDAPNVAAACGPVASGPTANWVVGTQGLYFTRDHEDDVRLTRNAAGEILLSTNANMNTMGGVEVDATRRNSSGNGLQLTYWGLYPGESFAEILGPGLSTYQTGLANVAVAPGAQPLQTFFDNADSNYTFRTNEFHNVEVNLLRNVGSYTTRRGRNASYELLGGFRWFQFNEGFGFGAFSAAGTPTTVEYNIDVENTLLGFQLGGRSEYCISDRLSAAIGGKIGVFNNRVNHRQSIADENGNLAYRTAAGVDDYLYEGSKDDLSMLGELDLGMSYRMSCNSRVVWGYRIIGVSGIALAPDQIPTDYTLDAEINSINSNGDLIVGGGYAGFEFCF